MNSKELKVSAIENGTVIDHIPVDSLFKVIRILNLENHNNLILYGSNLESVKMGKKAIIKIAGRFFEKEEIDKIAIVAPSATLTIIKDYTVIEKRPLQVPDTIYQFIKCINPNCITNNETVNSHFEVITRPPQELNLKCKYCEKVTTENNMQFSL